MEEGLSRLRQSHLDAREAPSHRPRMARVEGEHDLLGAARPVGGRKEYALLQAHARRAGIEYPRLVVGQNQPYPTLGLAHPDGGMQVEANGDVLRAGALPLGNE